MQVDKLGNRAFIQNSDYTKQLTPEMNKTVQGIKENEIILHDQRVIHTTEIETVISKLNEFIEPLRTNLKFRLHEKLNEYYVAVVNPLTDEVIKEIPPKKMLDMYAEMAELMGILIDQKI